MTFEFWIPGRLPGMNEIIDDARSNKFKAATVKKRWTQAIACLIRKRKPIKGRCHIYFVWIEPNLRRDPDNIRAGAKMILDGMVDAGVIVKDSQKYIAGLHDIYKLDRKNPGVRVIVRSL